MNITRLIVWSAIAALIYVWLVQPPPHQTKHLPRAPLMLGSLIG
jgi:hypothetical protein